MSVRWGSARLLPVVAALTLVAGYADLARGGLSVGAALLIAGYCVAVPAAILGGRLSR